MYVEFILVSIFNTDLIFAVLDFRDHSRKDSKSRLVHMEIQPVTVSILYYRFNRSAITQEIDRYLIHMGIGEQNLNSR